MRARCVETLVIACAVLLTASCHGARQPATGVTRGIAAPSGGYAQVLEETLSNMDRTVDPCEDFYRYACGGWLDRTRIPADRPIWSRSFTEIEERNLDVLREILEEPGSGSENAIKVGNFYNACMDEEAVDEAGVVPLRPLMAEITEAEDPVTLMGVVGRFFAVGITPFFDIFVAGDFKEPDTNIAYFAQGGLGLPDRDYYLKTDEKSQTLLSEYRSHVKKMFLILGEPEDAATLHADAVVSFETRLAGVSAPRTDMRDPEKLYNKVDIEGLVELNPTLGWRQFLEATGYPNVRDISLAMPPFFEGLEKAIEETPSQDLRAYLRWNVLHDMAPALSKEFVDENFAFFGQKLFGQEELESRWKRCVEVADDTMGDILGELYIERRFAGESKEIALSMIQRIEDAFADGLDRLGWMDRATRQQALEKMEAIRNKIGYPDEWIDYSDLEIRPAGHFDNVLAANGFLFRREANKIGEPVDPNEWGMSAPTVNAYYNPLQNEMVFPAGIMQPPFFDRTYPAPLNFGGIGMVMGHELTHGFDDQGRKFAGDGQLRQWWDDSAVEKFEDRAQCVREQYSGYEAEPGLFLNGQLTLGENIADLGGVKLSYRAFESWAKSNEATWNSEPFTSEQLFFLGFAQSWCTLATPEIERLLVTVNTHSLPRFRVNGPLSDFPEFAAAYECRTGTPMNPKNRCEVW